MCSEVLEVLKSKNLSLTRAIEGKRERRREGRKGEREVKYGDLVITIHSLIINIIIIVSRDFFFLSSLNFREIRGKFKS